MRVLVRQSNSRSDAHEIIDAGFVVDTFFKDCRSSLEAANHLGVAARHVGAMQHVAVLPRGIPGHGQLLCRRFFRHRLIGTAGFGHDAGMHHAGEAGIAEKEQDGYYSLDTGDMSIKGFHTFFIRV